MKTNDTNLKTHHQLRILIVDDEEAARYGMQRALGTNGYELAEASNLPEARAKIETFHPDLILLDVNLPGGSGLEFLVELQKTKDAPLVIMITAYGSERTAVEAIKTGAHNYLAKPFEIDELRLIVKNALETIQLRRENQHLLRQIEKERVARGALLGESKAMEHLRSVIEKVAETDATVLVHGESGTGKELIAREIHQRGATRRTGSFVALNCAALPSELIESELFGHEKGAFTGAAARRRGKFEQADGGTLFLDEIGDMSINVQAKLLRALEERAIERLGGAESIPVDVRIISATHRELEQEIAENRFRADLFYRLRVVTIEAPPLRERREDIPLLADSFAAMAAARYGLPERKIAPSALRVLLEYDWPGNVRELRNVIERAMVLSETKELTSHDLPEEINAKLDKPVSQISRSLDSKHSNAAMLDVPFTEDFRNDRREFERRYIVRCLDESNGNVTRAASVLGMHRQSLQHKLRELGLTRRYISLDAQEKSDT